MSDEAVELTVAGQTCRVVTSASPDELAALATMVEDKLDAIVRSGRPVTKQAMLLAAIALANDVREAEARATKAVDHCRSTLATLATRVDSALAPPPEQPAGAPRASKASTTSAKKAPRKKRSKPAKKSRGHDDER